MPKGPWQTISINIIRKLPKSKGYNAILVIVDQFTKKAYFLPNSMTLMSKGMAVLFWDNVFWEHGIPEKVISDRGGQFVSQFMKNLYKSTLDKGKSINGISPPDRWTDRVGKSSPQVPHNVHQSSRWLEWLLLVAQFCHNNHEHSTTGFSPFFLNNGCNPQKGIEPMIECKVQAVDKWIEQLVEACDQVRKGLNWACWAETMRKQYNSKRPPARTYKTGDKVYINAQNLPSFRPTKKFEGKFVGPYKVVGRESGTCHLQSKNNQTNQCISFILSHYW